MPNRLPTPRSLTQNRLRAYAKASAYWEDKPLEAVALPLISDQTVTYRILIAEDVPTNRLLLKKILVTAGFEVAEASNGQEAINLWQSWQPHLIIMDMQMPVMTGYEATAQIKQAAWRLPIPIIAFTSNTFRNRPEALKATGCDDFIYKPFEREHLLNQVRYHLALRYAPASQSPGVCYSSDCFK